MVATVIAIIGLTVLFDIARVLARIAKALETANKLNSVSRCTREAEHLGEHIAAPDPNEHALDVRNYVEGPRANSGNPESCEEFDGFHVRPPRKK